MTIQSLSSVTLATIENYRSAANQVSHAYRLGSRRLIGALNASLEKNLDPRAAKLAPEITTKVTQARGRFSDIVTKGIDEVSERAEKVVDMGTDGMVRQVHKAADFAAGVENPTLANGLRAAARLSLPPAKVALALSGKVAEGAKALSGAAKGQRVKAAVKKARATVARRSSRVKSQAAAAPAKAVKAMRRATAAPKKAAARAKKVAPI
jgi:histone H1/5